MYKINQFYKKYNNVCNQKIILNCKSLQMFFLYVSNI